VANNTPLSGLSDAAGGILLPPAQGELLTNGVLQEAGALAFAGDARTTSSRREAFTIWNGTPTAEVVGEGGTKPVTGAEFGGGTLNIKKIATIVTFTDEQIEDVQNGDMNVLVDSGVREAIADVATPTRSARTPARTSPARSIRSCVDDADGRVGLHEAGRASARDLGGDGFARGQRLRQEPGNLGVLIHPSFAASSATRASRACRVAARQPLSPRSRRGCTGRRQDPFYGLPMFTSTNLNTLAEAAGANKVIAVVATGRTSTSVSAMTFASRCRTRRRSAARRCTRTT
jgi:hypothetical protein